MTFNPFELYLEDDLLELDHQDSLVNEIRHLWNTRKKRAYNKLNVIEINLKLPTFYNVYTTKIFLPDFFNDNDDEEESFQYEVPNLKHVHVKGSRKSPYKIYKEKEKKKPKEKKLNRKVGRPKTRSNKTQLQKWIIEWIKQEKLSIKMQEKYLKKKFKLKEFKPNYKYGKVKWKHVVNNLEVNLKFRN